MTEPRSQQIERFLDDCRYAGATRIPLAQDASFRRYERIEHEGSHYILMDAPPPQEDIRPFIKVSQLLYACQLHAPHIYHADAECGLMLLEDLGSTSFSSHLVGAESPQEEWRLYSEAIDVLLALRDVPTEPMDLAPYDEGTYLRELAIFCDWHPEAADKEGFLVLWKTLLSAAPLQTNTLVLRDFHADNLMWCEKKQGLNRVGLLDYQDALIGDAAYDLLSLLEDARRDVSNETVHQALNYYLERSGETRDEFMHRYALLGAQRNLKIIGIFNRLAHRDGKTQYLELLPRVWKHLQTDLQHPALESLAYHLREHTK